MLLVEHRLFVSILSMGALLEDGAFDTKIESIDRHTEAIRTCVEGNRLSNSIVKAYPYLISANCGQPQTIFLETPHHIPLLYVLSLFILLLE